MTVYGSGGSNTDSTGSYCYGANINVDIFASIESP